MTAFSWVKAMTIEQSIFERVQAYQAEYYKDLKKKQRQIKTLHEINSKGAARVIDDIERQFDERWTEKRKYHSARIRDVVSRIKDQDKKKRLQYMCNLCVRCPEKVPAFKTAQEFFEWCGVDVSKPP